MANEFIIKNGFHSKGDSQVTGSLGVSGSLQIQGIADVSASIAAAGGGGSGFPFTGDAVITGSLLISASHTSQSLSVIGSGSTLFDVIGSEGPMLTVEDSDGSSTMLTALGNVKISGSAGTGSLTIESTNPFIEGAIPDKTGNNNPLTLKSSLPGGTGSYSGNYTSLKLEAAPISYGVNARGTSIEIHAGDNLIKDTGISESRGGNVLIESGKSSGGQNSGDIILAALHSSIRKGNIELKGDEIQIHSGSLVFQDHTNTTLSSTKNKITTRVASSGGSGITMNPLLIKPGDTTYGTGGIGSHLGIEGGDATNSGAITAGNVYINGGTAGSVTSGKTGSLFLKGGLINLNTTNTPWTQPGPVISESISLISAGNIHLSASGTTTPNGHAGSIFLSTSQNYSRQLGSLGVAISSNAPITFYQRNQNPYQSSPNNIYKSIYHDGNNLQIGAIEYVAAGGTAKGVEFWSEQKACFRVTTSNSTNGKASLIGLGGSTFKTEVRADTGSFKYLTGQSPLKIDTGGDILQIVASNFNVSDAGEVSSGGSDGVSTTSITASSAISSSGTITANSLVKGGGTSAQFLKADGSVDSSTYSTATGVENNADVTDATSVTAAGALMDSELTNESAVKGINQALTTTSNVDFNNVEVAQLTEDNITIAGTNGRLSGTTDFTYNVSNKLLSAPTASFDHLIVSQVISSSVINTSGSNIFGDESTDTQTLNGSVILGNITSATETDALFINGSNTIKKRTLQANAFTSTTIPVIASTSVTDLNDVTSAGSGIIITAAERTAIGTNTTDISTNTSDISTNTTNISGKLTKSSNLSDLTNTTTAKTNLGLGNVDNKSSSTIRGEITSTNVTTALGFTPTANTGTITSVTGTSPIASSGGTTPAISISAATNAAAGSMSATDKGKIDNITITSAVNLNTMDSSISSNTSNISTINSTLSEKAGNGANVDITSLTGLTTALSVAQGGTGATALDSIQLSSFDDDLDNTYVALSGTQTISGTKTFSVAQKFATGTVSAPSISFNSNNVYTTGFYLSNPHELSISRAGVQNFKFDSNGFQSLNSGTSQFTGHLQAHCLGIGIAPSQTSGEIWASGDVVANKSSDRRLKKKIKNIPNALEKVSQINGVTFEWKKTNEKMKKEVHSHEGQDVGVIAQEIEEVLPEIVATRDNGYKAVYYEKLVPLLIEAVKELKAEVDELKKSK